MNRKLITLFLALVFAIGLAVPAMAAPPYTLTLNLPTSTVPFDGTRTFQAVQIFTASSDGTNYAYELIEDVDPSTGFADLYAVILEDTSETDPRTALGLFADNDPDLYALSYKIWNALIGGGVALPAEYIIDGTTGTTSITFNLLQAGYYLVLETTGVLNQTQDVSLPMFITVVDDRTVNLKANLPDVDKTIIDADSDIFDPKNAEGLLDEDGNYQTFTYAITASFPNTFGYSDFYNLKFTDTLSNLLLVTTGDEPDTIVDLTITIGTTTLSASDYTLTTMDNYVANFSVAMDCLKLIDEYSFVAGNTITITYKASLCEDSVHGVEGNPNAATLEYSNNPQTVDDYGDVPVTPPPVVYTFGLNLLKIAEGDTDSKGLPGAEFELTDGTNTWTTTSDTSGFVLFPFLTSGTYTLTETKAPTGYQIPTASFEIIITIAYDDDGVYDADNSSFTFDGVTMDWDTNEIYFEYEIENTPGTILPETGGIGTTLLYVGGGVLILAAIALLIVLKKKGVKA